MAENKPDTSGGVDIPAGEMEEVKLEASDDRNEAKAEKATAPSVESLKEGETTGSGLQLENVENGAPTSSIEQEANSNPNSKSIHKIPGLAEPLQLDLGPHPADALHAPDSPTTSLIASLRSQLSLLAEQAHELNTKLVESISRHADLEDSHIELQNAHTDLQSKAEGLEKDKRTWEESMNTGLLVERSQIRDEMQKLAAGLVEEERRRGSAEVRRQQVESEVDDLAASLFDQANTMVAQERLGRVQAEERLSKAEENLAVAEAAVRDMQVHLQSMPTTAAPGTGSTVAGPLQTRKYLSSHLPYAEYISFLSHLRSLRPLKETSKNMFPPPLITNLLAQAFLARAISEDHEPTLRLETAPDISWLSRKGVNSAVIGGDLIIEPVSASTVISSSSNAIHDIGCALCGKPVFPTSLGGGPPSPGGTTPGGTTTTTTSHFGPPPIHPVSRHSSSSRFSLKPFFNTTSSPGLTGLTSGGSPIGSPLSSPAPNGAPISSFGPVYIFRIVKPASTTSSSVPLSSTGSATEKETKLYPLCKSGWCLERLRATCELWHFVRTGIVHVVWHGDDGYILPSEVNTPLPDSSQVNPTTTKESGNTPIPLESPAAGIGGSGAPEMNRKKTSGWALGFKLAEKAPTGWAKAWQRSSAGSSTATATVVGGGAGGGSNLSVLDSPKSPRRLPPDPRRVSGVGSVGAEIDGEEKESTASGVEEKAVKVEEKGREEGMNEKRESSDVPTSAVVEGEQNEKSGVPKDDMEKQEELEKSKETETTEGQTDGVTNGLSKEEESKPAPIEEEEDDLLASLQAQLEASEKGEDNPDKAGSGLGAPLELDTEVKQHQIPTIQEIASSPEVSFGGDQIPDQGHIGGAGLSRRSSISGNGDEFSTPKEEHSELPHDNTSEGGLEPGKKGGVEEEEEEKEEKEDNSATPSARGPAPPVPRRSPARSTPGTPTSASPTTTTKHHSLAISETSTAIPQDNDKSEVEKVEKQEGDDDGNEERDTINPVDISSRPVSGSGIAVAPPPLPPRHPKTPTMPNLPDHLDGEKAFIPSKNTDSWEVKTWKQVVKLKEEMWKTRIGVVDE